MALIINDHIISIIINTTQSIFLRFRLFFNKTATPADHEQDYTCHLWFQKDDGELEEAPTLTDHCTITYQVERE